jgi:hypothetical protein
MTWLAIDEDDENCDHTQYPESRKFGGWIICSNCGHKLGEWR